MTEQLELDEKSLRNLGEYDGVVLALETDNADVLHILSTNHMDKVRKIVIRNENTRSDTLIGMLGGLGNFHLRHAILTKLSETEEFSDYPWEWLVAMSHR